MNIVVSFVLAVFGTHSFVFAIKFMVFVAVKIMSTFSHGIVRIFVRVGLYIKRCQLIEILIYGFLSHAFEKVEFMDDIDTRTHHLLSRDCNQKKEKKNPSWKKLYYFVLLSLMIAN